jgi:hypothetical protein
MKFLRSITILILTILHGIIFAQYGYYPPASSILYLTDTLTINPPDSLPGDPVTLLGYNIYVDEDFYGNVFVSDPMEIVDYYLDDESLLPGTRVFCANAVYNEWISESACDTAFIAYGYELPVYEDWSSGSFETLQWTTDSDHWVIDSDEGNPSPSVSFQGEPGLTNYEAVLESNYINAVGIYSGRIWLDFDIKLEEIQFSYYEMLSVQIWNNSNQNWTTEAEYWSGDGSYAWSQEHINIKVKAMNRVFKIRFVAIGENSADISSWSLDNIHIYKQCDQPTDLEIEENLEYNYLTWVSPLVGCVDDWIHWDSGVNGGNSIGTGSPLEFDVAARWNANQLPIFNGHALYQIAFFPAESQATYSVRVWTGSGPDTMVVDQIVNSPVIGQWYTMTLVNPVEVDSTKDLWIGYHISTTGGYPAGVDDGPAINGYGNMMYYDSAWSTLLEINPKLDYNWNIKGHINGYNSGTNETFYIYRNKNQEGFEHYDIATHQLEYRDSNIVLSDYYCYRVTEIWAEEGDTCESDPTNTACEVLMLGTNEPEKMNPINIYPNPASTVLNIESPEKIGKVRIYNMLGECELKLEIGNSEGNVDVSGLGNGIYFVEVFTKDRRYSSKILITR